MPDVAFTRQAFKRLTGSQGIAILRLLENEHIMDIGVDFSLPDGYLFFVQSHIPSGNQIAGGISPEGDVST